MQPIQPPIGAQRFWSGRPPLRCMRWIPAVATPSRLVACRLGLLPIINRALPGNCRIAHTRYLLLNYLTTDDAGLSGSSTGPMPQAMGGLTGGDLGGTGGEQSRAADGSTSTGHRRCCTRCIWSCHSTAPANQLDLPCMAPSCRAGWHGRCGGWWRRHGRHRWAWAGRWGKPEACRQHWRSKRMQTLSALQWALQQRLLSVRHC